MPETIILIKKGFKMKAILRVQKLKTIPQILGVYRHNEQIQPSLNAASSIPVQRLYGEGSPIDRIKDLFSKYSIKPRKNAVLAAEYVLSASPEAFEGDSAIDVDLWAQENIKFLKKKHGDGLIAVWLHLHESSIHMHSLCTPLLKKTDNTVKLCARDFFGGREKLSRLQTQYANAMSQFGLERGVKGSTARHKTLKKFHGELNIRVAKATNLAKESLADNKQPSLLNYKKQHADLSKSLKKMSLVTVENEQLKLEKKLLEQRIIRAETSLRHSKAECRSLKQFISNHSPEFLQRLIKWANSFLYDPNAPDLKREREESIAHVLSCDASAKALAIRWAHVVRRLAKGDDCPELTYKK